MSSGVPSKRAATSQVLPDEVDVLIAGAGPTGLAAGLALSAKGVECLVVESATVPGRESSRATSLHAGTLELLDEVTLGQDLAAIGARADRSRVLRGERVLVDQNWTRLRSKYAFMLNLPQADIEARLRTRLQSIGGDLRFGCTVGGHREEQDGVSVEIAHEGEVRSVRCRFLIGCDGAHSAVRRGLGLSLEGETYAGTFVLADAELDGRLDEHSSWLGSSHKGLLGLLPLPDARWRLNATLDEEMPLERIDFDRLVQERLPTLRARIRHIAWSSTYTIHRRSASAMRRGRILLAGDAAHLNSPIGGQGMNRGIRDGFDLAWRLWRALHSEQDRGERLLVEWERERLEDARRVLAGADRLMRVLRARGARGLAAAVLLSIVSRIPPAHDQVCRQMAGLENARRIASRYRAVTAA